MKLHENQQFGAKAIDESDDKSASFEQAMLLTGYGRYNLILLLVCGLIMTTISCQYSLSAYIVPLAKCDLELSSSEMGLLNAAVMIGATTSAIILAAIADAMGRRKILIWTLFFDGCITLLSSLSQNFLTLFVFRCINGLALGGPLTILLSFFGEFHAEKFRAKVVCYLGLFWAFGVVLLPALAWVIIPLKFNVVIYGFVFNSWRLFLSIFGLPGLLGAFFLSKYPETPKFLLSQGQNAHALKIMQQMFVSNTKQEEHNYPVKNLISEYSITHVELNTLLSTLKKMWEQVCCLFSPPLGKYTILAAALLFANMFGYFGLGLWIPELFNRFEVYHSLYPNASITVCELAYLRQENITAVQPSAGTTTEICDNSVDPKVFFNTIIIGSSCLLGNLVTGYLADRWERRVMPMATALISGICGCLIYFVRTSMQNLIAACIFSAFISMANMVLHSVMIDIFPTNVNAMAVSVSSVIGRFGGILSNILFGMLLDINCEVPILLVGGVVILGGFFGFLLPKDPISLPQKINR